MNTKEQEQIKEALSIVVETIYFDDPADFYAGLCQIVEILGGKEASALLEDDEEAAYKKYCT